MDVAGWALQRRRSSCANQMKHVKNCMVSLVFLSSTQSAVSYICFRKKHKMVDTWKRQAQNKVNKTVTRQAKQHESAGYCGMHPRMYLEVCRLCCSCRPLGSKLRWYPLSEPASRNEKPELEHEHSSRFTSQSRLPWAMLTTNTASDYLHPIVTCSYEENTKTRRQPMQPKRI